MRAKARHLALSHVGGRFESFSGHIVIADPIECSSVEATIDAASINTGNAERDAHVRSPDFLEVERFPVLTYRGSRVARLTDERWHVDGELTIRDITRPVPLDLTYLGTGSDPWGGTRIALTATTQLARKDYEINWSMGLPGGFVLVGRRCASSSRSRPSVRRTRRPDRRPARRHPVTAGVAYEASVRYAGGHPAQCGRPTYPTLSI